MLEIWKVKYLQMPRFGDVIRSTGGAPARSLSGRRRFTGHPDPRLRHQLNRIRDLALAQQKK